jgi:RNA polymerase sigma-70 factor (ECF subfamily)
MRETVSLAFITALQLLPPRQRAALILQDVLGYRAQEAAEILDSTEDSVTSALKRARATLHERHPSAETAPPPIRKSPEERAIVEQFTDAFESHDLDGLVALLTANVRFSMPPLPLVWEGAERARLFLAAMEFPGRRLVATRANGQPAFALYLPDPHGGPLRAAGLLVLTLAGKRITEITRFETGVLPYFGMPRTLPA